MEAVDPQILGGAVIAGGISFAMVWLGTRMNMLEQRHVPRRCPSCGLRVARSRPCRCVS